MRISMKKVVKVLVLAAAVVGTALICNACSSKSAAKEQDAAKKNDAALKTLVAYFSATGVTKALATDLADVVHGDLFEIVPEEIYTEADLDWHDKTSRSSVEMNEKRDFRPAVKTKVENMEQYQVIYVGFPIWWYIAPTIINTFMESYNFEGKTVITFATSGGSGMGKTLENLKPSAPKANWIEGKVLNHVSKSDLEKWVQSLK